MLQEKWFLLLLTLPLLDWHQLLWISAVTPGIQAGRHIPSKHYFCCFRSAGCEFCRLHSPGCCCCCCCCCCCFCFNCYCASVSGAQVHARSSAEAAGQAVPPAHRAAATRSEQCAKVLDPLPLPSVRVHTLVQCMCACAQKRAVRLNASCRGRSKRNKRIICRHKAPWECGPPKILGES